MARFAQKSEADKYLRNGYRLLNEENSDIIIPENHVGMGETVRFELSQFLWKSMISMNGIWMT